MVSIKHLCQRAAGGAATACSWPPRPHRPLSPPTTTLDAAGKRIKEDDTPGVLGMEDEDIVEVQRGQTGGARLY